MKPKPYAELRSIFTRCWNELNAVLLISSQLERSIKVIVLLVAVAAFRSHQVRERTVLITKEQCGIAQVMEIAAGILTPISIPAMGDSLTSFSTWVHLITFRAFVNGTTTTHMTSAAVRTHLKFARRQPIHLPDSLQLEIF